MTRCFCNICDTECNDPNFFCEIRANRMRKIAMNPKLEVKDQIQQAVLHLCTKCFEERLKELT